MLNMTWEFKLEPTTEQVLEIEHILEVCRKVWNFALRERKDWLDSRRCAVNACSIRQEFIIPADAPFPSYARQCKSLTAAKASYPRLKTVNAQVLQQVIRKLEASWESWRLKRSGLPRFKKQGRMRSFLFPQMLKNCITPDGIRLPQLGTVKVRWSRRIPDLFEVKQARIVRKASGYFVMLSLQADGEVPTPQPHGHPVGIDVGLEYFLSTSEGKQVKRPRFFSELHRKLQLLQRRLKNKRKGSANWLKLQKKIGRVHQRITDIRKDWHFKLAHHLCDNAGMLFVEDLDFRILAKGMLGKHTLDAGLGQFVNQILPWVCIKRDVYYAKVDPRGTSQECPDCGAEVKKDLSTRIHHCHNCGSIKARDVAAAQVISTRGQRGIESDPGPGSQNACGVVGQRPFLAAGAGVTQPSQLALKQEIFGAIRGISTHIA